ncbi:MAG: methyltransferase MtaB domain-containing protein [Candidatus Omnitrophota bacterium]
MNNYKKLAISSPDDLIFGTAPKPVTCGFGLTIGGGNVFPELNFTLPTISIRDETWPKVRAHYEEIADAIIDRAKALSPPGLVVEFEQLPEMTQRSQWGAEITAILHEGLRRLYEITGIPSALRVTVIDLRDKNRPPVLREGEEWDQMREAFICAAQAGADILSIESVGGKEVHDEALLFGDLQGMITALGVLACRDMAWLWEQIVRISCEYGVIPGGDTACGFANTAMQLAGKGMLPSVLAALDRAASAPRSLVAFEQGAVGPSKDCAYEGPILKAIAGCPISMEGKSSSCAHFSPLGNIAAAAADLWSNESVQNIRLLSGSAPEAFLELLTYDCRLFNAASEAKQALTLRDCMVTSDVPHSVEALMLEPNVVLQLSNAIIRETNGYCRTVAAVRAACGAIHKALANRVFALDKREGQWFDRLCRAADSLPDSETDALAALTEQYGHLIRLESYAIV